MPNPTLIHPRTVKIDHYLKIVDFYISMNCPEKFLPEPTLGEYKPDVYFIDGKGKHVCVEIQLTPITKKKMQKKLDQFVSSHHQRKHDAYILLIVSDKEYTLDCPQGFNVCHLPVPREALT